MEETGCEIICGAPTTLVVKGLMMVMMMITQTINLKQGPHTNEDTAGSGWLNNETTMSKMI